MRENFQQAKELISNSHSILLTMHERMDGDDGGAVLAMSHALDATGNLTTRAIKHGVPPQLQFLPGSEYIEDDINRDDFDLIITFGCATLDRTGSEKIQQLNCPIINIDHHPDNTFFGNVNIVDKAKSSVAELVYDFFVWNGTTISKEIATCLLTGIITDTGSFKHSNTQSSTLEVAAKLMSKGALTENIITHTFRNKNPRILKAWGKAIENSYYDPIKQIIYSVVTEQDLQDIGKLPPASFEGFVETLNTVPEAKFALFLRQDGNIIKGSLRSGNEEPKNVDVSRIAQLFGGGGHKQAAGFSVVGKLQKDEAGKWEVI